jgi:hypothetical protein
MYTIGEVVCVMCLHLYVTGSRYLESYPDFPVLVIDGLLIIFDDKVASTYQMRRSSCDVGSCGVAKGWSLSVWMIIGG